MDNNKNIQSILREELEKEIPSSQIQLWPAMKASLATGKRPLMLQGENMNTMKPPGISRAAISTLIAIALLALGFITPQGRAFAQSVLQFFTHAKQDYYPLQTWQMAPPAQSTSELPFKFSVQEAESLAGYDVLSPVDIPFGMSFLGASYDTQYHIVAQAFGSDARYIELSLLQQPLEYYQPCGDISNYCDNVLGWNLVGASANLETVQIGDLTGEYVEGVWSLTAIGPRWEPTPLVKTLRWQTDQMVFELVGGNDLLGKDDLVALAASIR